MGRAEVGTPKYLANKMKAKGLQKLRWYCQMCEKQCRDENGFKCHTTSESHQRQLLLFADAPGKFLYSFSKEFSDGYIELLRRRFGTKRVAANKVYQEYIAVKEHIHMNATRWLTLSDYVKWLGRTGQVIADETEKGWYVTYIDRSPEAMERQAKAERNDKMEKDDEERMLDFIEKQIQKDKAKDSGIKEAHQSDKCNELRRDNDSEPLSLDIRLEKKFHHESKLGISALVVERGKEENKKTFKRPRDIEQKSEKRHAPYSSLDEIIHMEESKRERSNRKDYWLHKGIVVKFIDKKLGDKYYKQKAVILDVIDKYQAKIKFLESGEKLKVDQAYLETVIPALEKPILIVNGAYRGLEAVIKSLDEQNFCVAVEISRGVLKGRIVKGVQYDDISKLY